MTAAEGWFRLPCASANSVHPRETDASISNDLASAVSSPEKPILRADGAKNEHSDPVVSRLVVRLEELSDALSRVTQQRDREAEDAAAARERERRMAERLFEILEAVRSYASDCQRRSGAQIDALTVAAVLRGIVGGA